MPELPKSVMNLRRISQFVLQDNALEALPDTFTKLRSLTLLDLTNNLLYNIPKGFSALANMKTLILEGNNLETIPEGKNKYNPTGTMRMIRAYGRAWCDDLCLSLSLSLSPFLYLPVQLALTDALPPLYLSCKIMTTRRIVEYDSITGPRCLQKSTRRLPGQHLRFGNVEKIEFGTKHARSSTR